MNILCEFCKIKLAEYEGWFYAVDPKNEFAAGTASSGLLQRRNVCKECAEQAIKSGRTKAKKLG